MRQLKRKAFLPLAMSLSLMAVAGCAGGGSASGTRAASDSGLQCPRGFTVTCEVKKVGRIHHGSFGKNYESCACVHDSQRGTVPVIPAIR